MNQLIYISAPWCGPCRSFSPVMEEVASTGIPIQKVNADDDPDMMIKYGVRSIPTVIKTNSQGELIDKFVGVKNKQQVIEFYNG
jgi:thioredoxin 1